MKCSSHFYGGVPPQVLVTNCTIAVVKMIKPQNEWVYFELILSETEESVSQESLRESSDPMSTSLTDKLF